MKWKVSSIEKETEHRFLNFYIVHYKVEKDSEEKDYTYFLASRNEDEKDLRIYREEYDRPDAVLIGCYTIIDGELYLLLEKQFRPALNREVISFPAGLMDKEDKDIKETARREVKEETGYDVSEIELLLPPSPTSEGLSDECNAVVLARLEKKGTDDKEEFEDIDSLLCSSSKVKEMLEDENCLFSNSARLLILYLLERFRH